VISCRGVVLKKGVGTPFPHQIKRKTAPNSSNKVSIRLQEFSHWISCFLWRSQNEVKKDMASPEKKIW